MKITSTITVAKGLTVKREKDPEDQDAEVTRAHLRFTGLFVSRDQIDTLCRQDSNWARETLFDELGAPRGNWTLCLNGREWTVTGPIEGPGEQTLKLAGATLTGVELTLAASGDQLIGALMSGQLAWAVAGDEAGDAEPLLGRECSVRWAVEDGGQRDLLEAA